MKKTWKIVVALVAAACLAVLTVRLSRPGPPKTLGVVNGGLAACPDSPNCVSSEATDTGHRIAPIVIEGPPEETPRRAKEALGSLPRTKVVTESPTYIHAESTSLVFGFVDDVELLIDPGAKVVHVRSASRVGYSDLGVNRGRVEALRAAFRRAGGGG